MRINEKGILETGHFLCSPHQDSRPDESDISLIVLHNISLPPDQYGETYINDLFLGRLGEKENAHPFFAQIAALKVSAHFLILRDGRIIQYVSTLKRAWHAGLSCYENRQRCNDFSIGIELNGSDHIPYTLKQYQRLSELCAALFARHERLNSKRITTHHHIAPTRKTDPGAAFNPHFFAKCLKNPLELAHF